MSRSKELSHPYVLTFFQLLNARTTALTSSVNLPLPFPVFAPRSHSPDFLSLSKFSETKLCSKQYPDHQQANDERSRLQTSSGSPEAWHAGVVSFIITSESVGVTVVCRVPMLSIIVGSTP